MLFRFKINTIMRLKNTTIFKSNPNSKEVDNTKTQFKTWLDVLAQKVKHVNNFSIFVEASVYSKKYQVNI